MRVNKPMPIEMHRNSDLKNSANASALRNRSMLRFFALVFALSVPFWFIGALTGLQILPGLPVASLSFVCPLASALILEYRRNKTAGIVSLLKRAIDFQRIRAERWWYTPIILPMPGIVVLSIGLQRRLGGAGSKPTVYDCAGSGPFAVLLRSWSGRGVGLVGIRHRPYAGTVGRVAGRHSIGFDLGPLAYRALDAGPAIVVLDRMVVPLHGDGSNSHCVALQQHGEERLRHSSFPHDA
jgi:hypothetical protein